MEGKISHSGLLARSLEGHAARGMQIKGHEDVWVEIQANTFRNWVNENLPQDLRVTDLSQDLCTGVRLCTLVEQLQRRPIRPSWNKRPMNQHHYLENVTAALNAIEQDGVKLVNIGNVDIVNGNLKLILGLIWSLIVRYQIGRSKFPPRKLMLAWLQAVLPECKVSNLTTDWNSGVLLSALIDYCKPGLFPHWRNLDKNNGIDNCRRAMNIAQKDLGIPAVLEPEYLASPWLDELSGMTYLSYFMKPGSPGFHATLRWVNSRLERPVNDFTYDWNDGKTISEVIRSLGGTATAPEKLRGDPHYWESNWSQALESGKRLGVQPVLTAKDISDKNVEHLGVMAYAAHFQWIPERPPLHDLINVTLNSTSGRVGEPTYYQVTLLDSSLSYRSLTTEIRAPDNRLYQPKSFDNGHGVYVPHKVGMHEIVVRYEGDEASGGHYFRALPPHVEVAPPGMAPCALGSLVQVLVNATGAPRREDILVTAYGPHGRPLACPLTTTLDGTNSATFKPDEAGEWRIEITYQGRQIQGGPFTCSVFDPHGVHVSNLDGALPLVPHAIDVDCRGVGVPGELVADVVHDKRSVHCRLERVDDAGFRYKIHFTPKEAGKHRVYVYFNGYDAKGSPFMMRVGTQRRAKSSNSSPNATYRHSPVQQARASPLSSPAYKTQAVHERHSPSAIASETHKYAQDYHHRANGTPSPNYHRTSSPIDAPSPVQFRESPSRQTTTTTTHARQTYTAESGSSRITTQSPVRRPQSPVRRPQSPVRRPQSPLRRAQSPVRRPQSPVRRPQSPLRRAQSPVRRPQSPVRIVQSPVRRPQSPVRRPQSPVRRSQSPVRIVQSPVRIVQSPVRIVQSPLLMQDGGSRRRSQSPDYISSKRLNERKRDTSPSHGYGAATKMSELRIASPAFERRPSPEYGYGSAARYDRKVTETRAYRTNGHDEVDGVDTSPIVKVSACSDRAGDRRDSWDAIAKTRNVLSNRSLESVANLTEQQLNETRYKRRVEEREEEQRHDSTCYAKNYSRGDYDGGTNYARKANGTAGGAASVRVQPIPDGTVGRPVEFEIDGSGAGSGDLEILVEGGRVTSSVRSLGGQRFKAAFTPHQALSHRVDIRFNGDTVPGSPWHVNIMSSNSSMSVLGDATRLVPVNASAVFEIITSANVAPDDLAVHVIAPSKRAVQARVLPGNRSGVQSVEFVPVEVGTHLIEVVVNGEKLPSGPLIAKVYDAALIQVADVGGGVVGQPVQFRVDASQAGEGQLEISINEGEVPNHVQVVGGGRCLVSFTPDAAKPHLIDIKFNGETVRGCPFVCAISDTSRVTLSLAHLELIPLHQPSTFHMGVAGGGAAELAVAVRGPVGELPVKVTGDIHSGFTAEFTPTQVGPHHVTVDYNGRPVQGTPYVAKAFDATRVTVGHVARGTVGRPVTFSVDASEAGEGNLEITISARGLNIPTQVHPQGNARFAVSFVPAEACDHVVNVAFNKRPVVGCPLIVGVGGGGNGPSVTLPGPGPVHRPSTLSISHPGRLEDIEVNVEGHRRLLY